MSADHRHVVVDAAALSNASERLAEIGDRIGVPARSVADAVAAAAAQPLPEGAEISPALAAVQTLAAEMVKDTGGVKSGLTEAVADLRRWGGGLGGIQSEGAAEVSQGSR